MKVVPVFAFATNDIYLTMEMLTSHGFLVVEVHSKLI